MAQRLRIGLLFSVSEGWMGGTYYFLNIIAALNTLTDEEKPFIIIYASDTSGYELAKQSTGYPYLEFQSSIFHYTLPERMINKVGRMIGIGNVISKGLPEEKMPVLFGYYEQLIIHPCKRKVYWIPDFQEHYYPQFIGEEVSLARKQLHKKLISQNAEFVFSSEAAKNDFFTIYKPGDCKTSVVRFAVTHPDYSYLSIQELSAKYDFQTTYFFAPNQFWPHKNHMLVLKAIVDLKKKGLAVQVLFSGKMNDADSHVRSIKQFVHENELSGYVVFLGFLPREEQLCIMKNALAVIQPSYFEGWSTVVEDAKAMGKLVVVSDIPVHREQMKNMPAYFFDPFSEADLASKILAVSDKSVDDADSVGYQKGIRLFAYDFIKAIS